MGNALRARLALAKAGFAFTHSLGQNFLLDDDYIARIVDCAGVGEGDRVLEIGAGAGVLTHELASRGASVLALELDRALEPVLSEVLCDASGAGGARVVFQDAMKADLAALVAEAFGQGVSFRVVANLPYYITADMMLRLVRSGLPIESITVMVQQEAAERIMAEPDTKKWCALAATVQYYGEASVLMQVPPKAFTPPPHVMSALLHVRMYGAHKPVSAASEEALLRLISTAFAMRRKTLVNNLTAGMGMSRERALALLSRVGLPEKARGETLSIRQLCALADLLHETQESM